MEYKFKIQLPENKIRTNTMLQHMTALLYYRCYGGVVFVTNDIFDYSKLLLMDGCIDISDNNNKLLNISWNKNDIKSMLRAQQEINELIIHCGALKTTKDKLILLNNDITAFYTSTCHACGDKKHVDDFYHNEHIKITNTWGYNSTHDYETHTLVLCNKCYDSYILNGTLGKFVKIKSYH